MTAPFIRCAGWLAPGGILDTSSAGEFLDRFSELYLDSFLTNVVVGVLLGALGLFVILRRMVFLSAALSQVAGAGLALAFFLGALVAHGSGHHPPPAKARAGERLDQHVPKDETDQEIQDFLQEDPEASPPPARRAAGPPRLRAPQPTAAPRPRPRPGPTATPDAGAPPAMGTSDPPPGEVSTRYRHGRHPPISPLWLSLLITIGVALLLSMLGGTSRRSTREAVVGLVFILASAASIILAQLAEKGAHEIAEFLFGTVIFIPPEQQRLIYVSGGVTLLLYGWLFKDFVFVSFDPTAARAGRFPAGLANGTLFVLIAVSIALCTRAVGAMPVFALTVLPPTAALQLHSRMGTAVVAAGLIGAVSAAGGYFLSGLLNLSAGPLIVLVATAATALAAAARGVVNTVHALRARRCSAG